MTSTFVDASVLIAAARGTDAVMEVAFRVLDDPNRTFVSSELVRLEVLPKPVYHRRNAEVQFYEAFFARAQVMVPASQALVQAAYAEACQLGLSALDALHIAAAQQGRADEFVTAEKKRSPLFRARGLPITSIAP